MDRQQENALLNAIDENDIAEARRLLETGVSPNGDDLGPELSPLTRSVELGRLEIISLLFQHDVQPRIDELGSTELHLAAAKGDVQVLRLLLTHWREKGYAINLSYDSEPIHYAAMHGHLECLQLLEREAGSDIHARDSCQMTPLHYACEAKSTGATEVVRYLLASGAGVNAVSGECVFPIWLAACADNVSTLEEILRSSTPDLQVRNGFGETVLHAAAYYTSLTTLQMLVRAGSDIHARSNTNASILHRAAEAGRIDSVKWILENSSLQVNERGSHGWTALHYAANANQVKMAKFLLQNGADATVSSTPGNHTPLHLAAAYTAHIGGIPLDDRQDDATLLECLIQHGADIMSPADERALGSDWPRGEDLHQWMYHAQEDDPPLEDVYPLHCAVFSGNINMAKTLLAAGADIHSRTSLKSSTALHLAARGFMREMIRFLIQNGADHRLPDYGGRKMVHHLLFISRRGPERVKEFLVQEGLYEPSMEGELDVAQACRMMVSYYGRTNLGGIER